MTDINIIYGFLKKDILIIITLKDVNNGLNKNLSLLTFLDIFEKIEMNRKYKGRFEDQLKKKIVEQFYINLGILTFCINFTTNNFIWGEKKHTSRENNSAFQIFGNSQIYIKIK